MAHSWFNTPYMHTSRQITLLLASILLCNFAGLLGSYFTTLSVDTWYVSLTKPDFTPPSWIFAPVWTALYTMMGVALYLVWSRLMGGKRRLRWIIFFFVHLGLNVLWSYLFFGHRDLLFGLIGISALWLSIAWLMLSAFRFERRATLLLLPYLAWVSFAGYLNYTLWEMNK